MYIKQKNDTEIIQKMIARTVATHPAGRNLMLIGGFRYRLLDSSVRTSNDIDYHRDGDLQHLYHYVCLLSIHYFMWYLRAFVAENKADN